MPGFTWSTRLDADEESVAVELLLRAVDDDRRALGAAPVTYEATLSRCSRVMSGPISLAESVPSPMTSAPMRLRTASTRSSATSPTATSTDTAMQRSPAEP